MHLSWKATFIGHRSTKSGDMFAGSLSEFVRVVSGTFFVLYSATKTTQCPRKRIGKLPQCCWMASSEETGALVLTFFLGRCWLCVTFWMRLSLQCAMQLSMWLVLDSWVFGKECE